jgi:undecaprenyl-diphosphatase
VRDKRENPGTIIAAATVMTSVDHLQRRRRAPVAIIAEMLRSLGWFYGLALALAIAALAGFAGLAEGTLHHEAASFNRSVLAAIHASVPLGLRPAMLAITDIGSVYGIAAVGGAMIVWLARTRRVVDAVTCAVAIGGAGVLSLLLKAFFREPRPTVFTPLTVAHGFSFPSGHSLESFCLYGFIAVWLVLSRPRAAYRWLAAVACIIVPLAVAFSRMYLGVHWPTDVSAGILVAVAWLAACFAGREWFRRRTLAAQRGASPIS